MSNRALRCQHQRYLIRILTLIGDVIAKRAKRCQRSNEQTRFACGSLFKGGGGVKVFELVL